MQQNRRLFLASAALAVVLPVSAVAQVGTPAASASGAEAGASPAAGGTADPGDIIVTATRRGESLQRVPISVSALTNEALERQGVRNIADVTRLTPGLNYNSGGDRGLNTIAIRGIESSGGASPTGIYIDDVPIQARRVGYGGGSPFPRIFDLDRVEVLRGPQGTLFGAGSEGGTVRFITTQPSLDTMSGYSRAELSSTEHGAVSYETGAALGGPLVEDKLGFRISAWHRRDGGYVDRVDFRTDTILDKNANSRDATVVSASLKFKPVDGIELTPAVFYQREYVHDVSSFWTDLSDPSSGRFYNGNVLRSPTKDRFVIYSLTGRADLGRASIVSVTSYLDRKLHLVADYTQNDRAALGLSPFSPPGAAGPALFDNAQRSFNQELRLQSNGAERFRWVIGAFYQRSVQYASQVVNDPTLPAEFEAATGVPFAVAIGQPLVNGQSVYIQNPYRGVDTQIAGFGQVDFDITPKLTATAGLRVARTKFTTNVAISGPFGGVPFTDGGSQSETPVTPKFGLQYQLTPLSNVYVSAAKGYRVGGFNPQQLSICQPQQTSLGLSNGSSSYNSDSVWSYELGSKNRLFDRRLTLNGSAYYIRWSNIQQFVNLASCLGGFIANLGKATSTGGDLEFQFQATKSLTIGGSMGYNYGKFNKTVGFGNSTAVIAGDRLPGSPWKVTLNSQYDFALGGRWTSYIRADYQFASADPRLQPPTNIGNGLNYVPGYYTRPKTNYVSTRIGFRHSGLEISAFVDNLFDSAKILERVPLPVAVEPFRATAYRPRTVGLTASYRY